MEDEHIIESEHTLARQLALSLRAHGTGACPSELELAGYLDGLASEAEGERIEAHLAACAECRQAIIDARLLAAEPPTRAPRSLVAHAKALVPAPAARRGGSRWRRVASWAAAAAASVAVGSAGLHAGSSVQRAREERARSLTAELSFGAANGDEGALPPGDDVFQALLARAEEGSHE